MHNLIGTRNIHSFVTGATVAVAILLVSACSTVPASRPGGNAANSSAPEQTSATGTPGGQPPRVAPASSEQLSDGRGTEQLCHDLLHKGRLPANAANDPQRCE